MESLRAYVERSVQLYNDGDLDRLTAMYAEDAVELTPAGNFTGLEAISERLRSERLAFADRRITPRHLTVEGDTAVLEYDWTATHTGPLRMPDGSEMSPTRAHVAFPVVSAFAIQDGKITEHRMYFDQLSTLIQLGVVKPPS